MSIPVQNPIAAYTGNGSATQFAYNWYLVYDSDLKVQIEGVAISPSLYTVTGVGNVTGGNVVFNTPPAAGARLLLQRDIPLERETNYVNNGDLLAATVNADFDRIWMALQDVNTSAGYAVRVQDKPLPPIPQSAAERAGKLLGWDSLGNPISTLPASGSAADVLLRLANPSEGDALIGVQLTGGAPITLHVLNSVNPDVVAYGASVSTSDNTAAFNANKSAIAAFVRTALNTYSVGVTDPDFKLTGSGGVVSSGITALSAEMTYNPSKENVVYAPGTFLREKTGEPYPTRENPLHLGQCYRFVLSQGSKLDDDSKTIHHVAAVGNTIGCDPIDWQFVDAFGVNTLMYAGRVQRTTAVGSESMAWFGSPSQQSLIDNCHDFWRKPAGNPYLPGEPGWNAGDLETNFPGIGARLGSFTNYVTTSEDAGYCAAFGRDALNHIVRGIRNVSMGYQSAAYMFNASYNVSIGTLAMQSCVFGDANTAIGDQAGKLANDCFNSVFVGYGAGRTVRSSTGGIYIGDRTADNVLSANKAVIIGSEAGSGHPVSLDNKLIISTSPSGGNAPLISGNFLTASTGVNVTPEKIRAHQHIRDTDSGSTLTPPVGLLVEAGGVAGVTIESRNTGTCTLNFADPESASAGYVQYSHNSDSMTMGVGGVNRWRIENTGGLIPMADNAYTIGRVAFRPSVIYAGTGTINTSDAREKTSVTKLTDKEIAVGLALSEEIGSYKWLDRIKEKGDDARKHFGLTVQRAIEIFKEGGLDAFEYGAVCYDKWESSSETTPEVLDEDGNEITPAVTTNYPAGEGYSFRPDELTYLMVGATRANQLAIEKRLLALESK